MIKFTLLFSLCLLTSIKSIAINLDYIRSNYEKAVSDKSICEAMINELEQSKLNNVQLAYLGGLQTIWANHTNNPLSKLNTFKKGKANIAKAIKSEKSNVEIRFVRLSIQKNCPKFLGYSENIVEDEHYLKAHFEKVKSENLKKMMNKILKS